MSRSGFKKARTTPRPPKPAVAVLGTEKREVCSNTAAGLKEYKRRRAYMWERDNGICCICGQWVSESACTFEHFKGRGHGGGHRDDRTEIDGVPCNGIAHWGCNNLKGSQRRTDA